MGGLSFKSKICVSIAEPSLDLCKRAAAQSDLAEIRLDLAELTPAEIEHLFSQHAGLIATCRSAGTDPAACLEHLLCAIRAGAALVDVELESEDVMCAKIVRAAHARDSKVIISYHNFHETPGILVLQEKIKACLDRGADLVKIACMVNSMSDNARLLGLLDGRSDLIVVGMGEFGRITRIAAPLLRSPFTYACLEHGRETAPAQLTKRELEEALKFLERMTDGRS